MAPSTAPLVLGEVTDMTDLRGVRHSLGVRLQELGFDEDCVDDAMVMVTELAANAVEHGSRWARVSLDWSEQDVRVSVWDDSDDLPAPQDPAPTRIGGRGLMIVEAFADRHGTDVAASGGKTVWFELDRPH